MEPCVAVKDASVLIDLANGDLIGHWFSLGIQTIITDSVRLEISMGKQDAIISPFIDAGLIQIDRVEDADALGWLTTVASLSEQHLISFADATALLCAKQRGALLLTGDGRLRREASGHGVTVRGVLWILDLLVSREVLNCEKAVNALDAILSEGGRLPEAECQKRRRRWGEGKWIETGA